MQYFAMPCSSYAEVNEWKKQERKGFQSDMLFEIESIIKSPEEVSNDKVKIEERPLRFI